MSECHSYAYELLSIFYNKAIIGTTVTWKYLNFWKTVSEFTSIWMNISVIFINITIHMSWKC